MSTHDCTGDQCGYRRLYESSQSSLADMSARQGQALSRVGRLRAGMATALRRHYPDLATKAEQQMGSRLSDVDDEILIAYLDAFAGARSTSSHLPVAALADLKAALKERGLSLSGDDPQEWAQQLRASQDEAHAVHTPLAAAVLGELHSQTRVDATQDSPPASRRALPVFAPPANPQEPVREVGLQEGTDEVLGSAPKALGALFSDLTVELWEGPLGEVEAPDGRWSPSPVKARTSVAEQPSDAPAVPPSGSRKNKKNANKTAKRMSESPPGASEVDTAPTPEVVGPDHSPGMPVHPHAKEPVEREPAQLLDAGSLPGTPRAATEDTASYEDIDLETLGVPPLHETPLRPELSAPSSTKKRKGRSLRTQAQAPEDLTLYPSPEPTLSASSVVGTLELSEDLLTALTAAASIPRPVFMRDLVEVGGSLEAVEAWEEQCRSDPASYPIRFIAPKMRHRARGSLVFSDVHPATGADAWWQRCVTTYRGARLYEMGVLLHRVGDELVSSRFTGSSALLRLSTGKGLVGVVVTFDAQLEPESEAREGLKAAMEELLSERLVLIACLTTSGENSAIESLLASLSDLALQSGWSPTAPVVAARSWEYADNRGTTAVLALGG